MTITNQDSPHCGSESSLIDREALRRFGRWWEARVAQVTEKEQESDPKDAVDAA